MLEEQGIAKATAAPIEEVVFAAKCRALQVADDKLKQEKTRSTLNLLKKQCKEAPRLQIQPPLAPAQAKRMYAPNTPLVTAKAKVLLTNASAPRRRIPILPGRYQEARGKHRRRR